METPSLPSKHYFTVLLTTLLLILHLQLLDGARPLPHQPTTTSFIVTSCKATLYPDLCIASLSTYASTIHTSPNLLAHTALWVTLDSARNASMAMKSMSSHTSMSSRVASVMHDCMEDMAVSVRELKDSLGLMGNMGGRDVGFQLNSIQTWVSAAMTDDNTCMDGFEGKETDGDVKDAVRGHVVKIVQLTSNALAFINCLASSTHGSP